MTDRRRATALAAALFVITMGVNLHAPLYAAYARQDGYGAAATTTAFAFYVAGVIPVLLCLGGLSDRIGRRPVLALALALSAAATLVMMAAPHVVTLAAARLMLGVGTALMSTTATAYMMELLAAGGAPAATNWVTTSTSLGFGIGPALTSLALLAGQTMTPPSLPLHLSGTALAGLLVWGLPETSGRDNRGDTAAGTAGPMLRLPYFSAEVVWFGGAILLCWATTGVTIAILPVVLEQHGLAAWSGLSSMLAISCGLLFQPWARRLPPGRATRLGLAVLLPAYALMAWGAVNGQLAAVALGSFASSSACYGFVYLGGLSGSTISGGRDKARASAGFFLFAYLGFSVPVIGTGLLADAYGQGTALAALGGFIACGVVLLFASQPAPRLPVPA